MSDTYRVGRRVVRLSSVDARRVAAGLLPEAEEEEQRRRHLDALTQAQEREGDGDESANDARLLHDVPPHWA